MSSARRPLLTATAAGTLLGALWFVPSANASQDTPARTETTTQITTQARAASSRTMSETTSKTASKTSSQTSSQTSSETSSESSSESSSGSSGSAVGTMAKATADDGTRLADTGSFDTTPYLVGGTALLALGAGFVVYSVRRERLGF